VLLGFHHVTAFAGEAQANLDFYTRDFGLRLVKRTVNFDDPAQYHFYFGDARGTPGTLATFFAWPSAPATVIGSGQIASLNFAVSPAVFAEWMPRRAEQATRFGERWIALRDPAGLRVELVEADDAPMHLHSVALRESDPSRTAGFLRDVMGFACVGVEGDRTRLRLGEMTVDVVDAPGLSRRRLSSGMVHHFAFRVADEAAQLSWREKLTQAGLRVTRVIDRVYFKSIYFREPGGALFEMATDGPGFLVDEGELGSGLRLPPWLEEVRESIERRLPAVHV
jgi:glyoxalase family protein